MSADALILSRPAITPETPFDAAAIDALILAAFGPGRYAKTAERLREGRQPATGFTARDPEVIGSVRLWDIRVGDTPALFLGPIAVSRDSRREGVGADLVAACLAWAQDREQGVLLVGDAPYFCRFGFQQAEGVILPGPVDRRRLLWRGDDALRGAVTV
jgi:predicted N-acetyltransferase YhbS